MKIHRTRGNTSQATTRDATPEERAALVARGYCTKIREWADGELVLCADRPELDGVCLHHRAGADFDATLEPEAAAPAPTRADDPDAGVMRILTDKKAALADTRKAAAQKAVATRRARLAAMVTA